MFQEVILNVVDNLENNRHPLPIKIKFKVKSRPPPLPHSSATICL